MLGRAAIIVPVRDNTAFRQRRWKKMRKRQKSGGVIMGYGGEERRIFKGKLKQRSTKRGVE